LKPRFIRPTRLALVLALAATTSAAIGIAPVLSSAQASSAAASAKISKITISGTTVTVTGSVTLPENASTQRSHTRVLVTLSDGAGKTVKHTAKINSRRDFKSSWKTTLTGSLKLTVQVAIEGKLVGKSLKRTVTVTNPNAPVQLLGLFKLAAGSAPAGAAPTGSYFEMLQSDGTPLSNASSPAANKDYTPFTPGTQGGLSTVAYQKPPSPAFSGGTTGGALASEIVKPVPFFAINFSVVTASADPQVGTHDPLPSITATRDKLTGQITAWSAQWNGQSFNQGTPKPDGSVPAPTTPLSGTYDPTTRAFTLTWKSLIVGGPFNGFAGYWHLQGTFVPASH
jgi:hypothetical protein